MRISRVLASTGVRLAIVQAALLITAFALAGALTKVSVKLIYRQELHSRILGEVAAHQAMFAEGGVGAVARDIAEDERRPGGLDYRLAGPDGRVLSGDLPATGSAPGWAYLDRDDKRVPGRPVEDLIVYTARLPDGSMLTVGQDLSEESRLRHALKRTLFWCGAAGSALGLAMTFLLARGALRRVDGMVSAARAVSAGQMQVRAPTRATLAPDDLDELAASFNAMLDEIATLVSRVRWISTDIAHDLRTPLTHVRQKLDQIKSSPDDSAQRAAHEIETDVNELLRTFDAMLRLAEIENGVSSPGRSPMDLADLVGRIADAYRPDIEAGGRRLEVTAEPVTIDAEADLVAQAIVNLVENALRHTPVGARIDLRAETIDGAPAISVVDDGPGIPADQREAVLQRFHRLEHSRTTPGSGLGLAIVAAVARRHDAEFVLTDAAPGLHAMMAFPHACPDWPQSPIAVRK